MTLTFDLRELNLHLFIKGGYLDFSHLTELKNIYITEIYMKKQCKSSRIKNHKITRENFFDGVPLKGYIASKLFLELVPELKKRYCGNIQ